MGRTTIFKWIFFAFNIILLCKALYAFTTISLMAANFSTRTLIGFIVLNVLFVFISILGCCSAYKEDALLIKASVISLLVLFIYELLFEFAIIDNDRSADKRLVEEKWAEEIEHPDAMAYVQYAYQCCGKDSPDDYKNILHRPIPISCYNLEGDLYGLGCLEATDYVLSPYRNELFQRRIYALTILMFAIACYLTWYFTKHQLNDDPSHLQETTT